jgi:hypothetical protein
VTWWQWIFFINGLVWFPATAYLTLGATLIGVRWLRGVRAHRAARHTPS